MFESTTIINGSTESLLPGLFIGREESSPLDLPQLSPQQLSISSDQSTAAFDLRTATSFRTDLTPTPLDMTVIDFQTPPLTFFSGPAPFTPDQDPLLPNTASADTPLAGGLALDFNQFEDATGLIFNGNAALEDQRLRLTSANPSQAGSVFWSETLPFYEDTSFQTSFSFQITGGDGRLGASGLTFILQNTPAGANALGTAAGGMGYALSGDRSFAIEFDTNQGLGDVNGNHVSLLQNGIVSIPLATAIPSQSLTRGDTLNAWVDYEGSTNSLTVYLSRQAERPKNPLIETTIDLSTILEGQAYVGFSAGTGTRFNQHDIQQWSFNGENPTESTLALHLSDIEVDETAEVVNIDVIRTGVTNRLVSVDYDTADDTAFAGNDYVAQTGTLTFAPGEIVKTISIQLLNDRQDELDEQFSLSIGNETDAILGTPRSALIKILDEDPPALGPRVEFSLPQFVVNEGGGIARTYVRRLGNLNQTVSVRVTAGDDEANSRDYRPFSKILTFIPGQRQKQVLVNIREDQLPELGEDIRLFLSNPNGSKLGLQAETAIRILDNDVHPFSVTSETIVLPSGGGRRAGVTSFDWTPDGAMLIAQANGVINRWEPGQTRGTPFLDISQHISRASTVRGQGGVMGIAIHPDFANNPYVYFAMSANTYNPPGPEQEANPHSYVIRVEADPSTGYRTAIAGSEQILFKIPTNDELFHASGGLRFGEDGSLFYSHGDSSLAVTLQAGAFRSLDLDSPQGKLFRINPSTGEGYADNPFATTDLSEIRSKVYSYGLRNPFRFAIQPGTSEPFLGDVGQTSWEEINTGRGRNFGWPFYEGGNRVSLRQPSNANNPLLQNLYAQYETQVSAPLYARNHDDNAVALLVGDFYTGGVYPTLFEDALFFSDFGTGEVNAVLFNDQGAVESVTPFTQASNVAFMAQGPDGLLYYADLSQGTINRWVIT